MSAFLSFDWSKMLAFNWGVFWAVLAALVVVYLLHGLLRLAVPTRSLAAEELQRGIHGELESLTEKVELSSPEGQLSDIQALLEYQLGVTAKEARESNIEREIAEEDEHHKSAAEKARNSKDQK